MIQISRETELLLEDIERRIDPETEEDFVRQWEEFLYDRFEGELFSPKRKKLSSPTVELSQININDALEDHDLMLRSQLSTVSWALSRPNVNLCIRANYGTGIMTSIFGAKIFKMPRENNTLPTTHSFNDTEKIREIYEKGIPDISTGFGKNVFEFGELCREVFEKYPKIKKYVKMYHPDTQGPLDVTELLWGGEMFYAMYDEPELVHGVLSLVCDTYCKVLDRWFELFTRNSYMNPHWNTLWHRGTIMIRNDSAMNLSPELYDEFAAPYDGRLLDYYDGGVVHFCGRGDHYIESLCSIPKLYGINMSQPQYNDMEKIYKNTVDKGLKILAFNADKAKSDLARPGGFHHNMSI